MAEPIIASIPFISPILDPSSSFFKCLLMGEPGSGKSRAFLTLPDWMFPIGVVDVDDKMSSMPELFELRKEGKLDVFPIRSSVIGTDGLKSRFQKSAKLNSLPPAIEEETNAIVFIL